MSATAAAAATYWRWIHRSLGPYGTGRFNGPTSSAKSRARTRDTRRIAEVPVFLRPTGPNPANDHHTQSARRPKVNLRAFTAAADDSLAKMTAREEASAGLASSDASVRIAGSLISGLAHSNPVSSVASSTEPRTATDGTRSAPDGLQRCHSNSVMPAAARGHAVAPDVPDRLSRSRTIGGRMRQIIRSTHW